MSLYYPQAAVNLEIFWEDWTKQKAAKAEKSYSLIAIPKNISVEINTYKEADSCRFTLDYKNFPFEPRNIRSMRVVASMANQERLFNKDGSPNYITADDFTDLSDAARDQFKKQLKESTVFTGFADETEIDFNNDRREVTIECRDQTSLLIDRRQPRTVLDLSKDIFTIIRQILDKSDSTKPLTMEVRLQDAATGNVEKTLLKTNQQTPQNLKDAVPTIAAVAGDIKDSKKSPKKNETAWDVINELCKRVALVPYIELDRLIITKPRLLFKDSNRRVMTWGINLKSLSFKRKLGRDKGLNVEVRSLSVANKKVIKAEYPFGVTGLRQTIAKMIGGEEKRETAPKHVFFVPDIVDEKLLLDRAQDIWEEMARQEIEGTLSTKDMILCDSDGTLFKTLAARMGTPIEIQIEPNDMEALGTLSGQQEKMRAYLVSKCYKRPVADALAASFELMRRYQPPFYTKKVTLSIDHAQGFSADINFINFVELNPKITQEQAKKRFEERKAATEQTEKVKAFKSLLKGEQG